MIERTEKEIMQRWRGKLEDTGVTIRCLTYNHEDYIGQCLDGFLMQITDFPFQIIVHDDASTDKTAKIIQMYADSYPNIVVPIFEKENQYTKHDGSIARIIKPFIKGAYVAVCEGDDYWNDSNKLEVQHDFLVNHPDYVCVGHLTNVVDMTGNNINPFVDSKPGEYTIADNDRWQLFAHLSSYLYKNFYRIANENEIKLFSIVKSPGDRKWPVFFLQYGKMYVLPYYYSTYRYMSCEHSYMSTKSNFTPYRLYMECYNICQYAKECGLDIKYEKIMKERMYYAFSQFCLGHDAESIKKILKLRKNPWSDVAFCSVKFIMSIPGMARQKLKFKIR